MAITVGELRTKLEGLDAKMEVVLYDRIEEEFISIKDVGMADFGEEQVVEIDF